MNRSDFFIGRVNAGFMYVVAASCRLKAQRPPAESEVLHRNQLQCRKRSILSHVSRLFAFRLD
ncbi:hypothetical protein DC421_13435 [Priestia megaterium]|nr:hypothetical protein C0569_18315 [Priestia megaterium]PVE75297.1 hypothetical protein DC428_05125 [Priestia megaterium]PVE84438.1 hypothetical protein DC421_13435 [Priestia megaterium]PVE86285.1 hypothetical protein DC426_18085 [Priestia megaterium]PVE96580.1 hypothetical protein DC433_19920 [Priestia megaterium]